MLKPIEVLSVQELKAIEIAPWVILGVFVTKEIVSLLIRQLFKRFDQYASDIKELQDKVVVLFAEIKSIQQHIEDIPKMQKDLHEAFAKLRSVQKEQDDLRKD